MALPPMGMARPLWRAEPEGPVPIRGGRDDVLVRRALGLVAGGLMWMGMLVFWGLLIWVAYALITKPDP